MWELLDLLNKVSIEIQQYLWEVGVFVVALILVVLLFVFNSYAYKGKAWAFITCIVIYGIDTLFFFLGKEWLGSAFRVIILYFLVVGAIAAVKMKKLVDLLKYHGIKRRNK